MMFEEHWDREQAERWCEVRHFEWMAFQCPGNWDGTMMQPGKKGFTCSGWWWPYDSHHDKKRIFKKRIFTLADTLEECVLQARAQWAQYTAEEDVKAK